MQLQVGIVGLGETWDWGYRPALKRLVDLFRVTGIYDPVFRRAQLACEDFQAEPAQSFRSLIFRSDVAVVLLLGTDWLGPLPVTVACESGKPVFLGAPFEFSLADLRELMRVAEATGQLIMPALGLRSTLSSAGLRELMRASLGQPRQIFCYHRILRWGRCWRTRLVAKLGELIDGCRFLLEESLGSVLAGLYPPDPEGCPSGLVVWTFEVEGAAPQRPRTSVEIVCEWFSKPGCLEGVDFRGASQLHLHCEGGVACFEEGKSLSWWDTAGHHRQRLDGQCSPEELLLTIFYQAVTSNTPVPGDLRDVCSACLLLTDAKPLSEGGAGTERGKP